ncbi:MAG: hypothetical protein GY944_00345, partial [bacterium]|nr:hypothetical protein [bacterium]
MHTNEFDVPDTGPGPAALENLRPPAPVTQLLTRIADAGHGAWLVGECVLLGLLGPWPGHFRAESSISRKDLLAFEPRAIPTGVRSGRITVPTAAGPVDVLPDTGAPRPPRFRILDLAFDAARARGCASEATLEDLRALRLTPGAGATQQADPLFALEAARMIATLGLRPTDEALACASEMPFEITGRERARMRRLLRDTLLGPGCHRALHWLRECGIESALVSGIRSDAPDIVASVAPRARVRFAAWLLDADARGLFRGLRFGSEFATRVYRLLEWHPIERHLDVGRDAAVR